MYKIDLSDHPYCLSPLWPSLGRRIRMLTVIRTVYCMCPEAVSPVCLPVPVQHRPEEDPAGKDVTVVGWGNTSPNRRQSEYE